MHSSFVLPLFSSVAGEEKEEFKDSLPPSPVPFIRITKCYGSEAGRIYTHGALIPDSIINLCITIISSSEGVGKVEKEDDSIHFCGI